MNLLLLKLQRFLGGLQPFLQLRLFMVLFALNKHNRCWFGPKHKVTTAIAQLSQAPRSRFPSTHTEFLHLAETVAVTGAATRKQLDGVLQGLGFELHLVDATLHVF